MYANSMHLYNQVPVGDDRIIGEYEQCFSLSPLSSRYRSDCGGTPEQARLVREFLFGVGEIIAGVFCATVSRGTLAGISYGVAAEGLNRIYSSLNSLWAIHQTELEALREWEKTALKPAVNQ